MRIIPVIDLLAGQVVRGIAGRRESYRPLQSRLVAGSNPAPLAAALSHTFGAAEFYVADLDAIGGRDPSWEVYTELLGCGLSLWIDAGLDNLDRARELARFAPRVTGIIAGLESLPESQLLAQLVESVGPERLIFSLDLKQGQPQARDARWQQLEPLAIAREALALGVRRMIVLDLAGVGVGAGVPTLELCRALRETSPELEITSGGGVRGAADLRALEAAGCDAALVASALHDGRLTPDEVSAYH